MKTEDPAIRWESRLVRAVQNGSEIRLDLETAAWLDRRIRRLQELANLFVPAVMTSGQAARAAGCSKNKVWRAASIGELEAGRLAPGSSHLRIRREDLLRWCRERTIDTPLEELG